MIPTSRLQFGEAEPGIYVSGPEARVWASVLSDVVERREPINPALLRRLHGLFGPALILETDPKILRLKDLEACRATPPGGP